MLTKIKVFAYIQLTFTKTTSSTIFSFKRKGGGRAGPGSAFALHVHDRHPEIKRYQFEITNDFCLKTEQLFK